ncbi:hypothetical protein ACIBI9_24060 [Nonomuraea sp. NPDC050451]|uniref:hypothetical protein n=1 Tax=Nonomuraea sp. NPDC050451 TaxID=3364364 RepID=UPI003792156F
MTGLEIALGAAGQEASRIRTHGENYGASLAPMQGRGDGVSSWGDDGLFAVFASTYAECRAVSMAALSGLSQEMDATGEGLQAVVKNTGDTEAANVKAVQDLDRAWA